MFLLTVCDRFPRNIAKIVSSLRLNYEVENALRVELEGRFAVILLSGVASRVASGGFKNRARWQTI